MSEADQTILRTKRPRREARKRPGRPQALALVAAAVQLSIPRSAQRAHATTQQLGTHETHTHTHQSEPRTRFAFILITTSSLSRSSTSTQSPIAPNTAPTAPSTTATKPRRDPSFEAELDAEEETTSAAGTDVDFASPDDAIDMVPGGDLKWIPTCPVPGGRLRREVCFARVTSGVRAEKVV